MGDALGSANSQAQATLLKSSQTIGAALDAAHDDQVRKRYCNMFRDLSIERMSQSVWRSTGLLESVIGPDLQVLEQ